MGGVLAGKRNRKQGGSRDRLTSEKGYLLLSTVFFLMFSGLFAQSMIKVAGNHVIQLRQLSGAYEAKSALNISEEILLQETRENELPVEGLIKTSEGRVSIKSKVNENEYLYTLTLTTNNGAQFSKDLIVAIPERKEDLKDEPEEPEELLEDESKDEVDTSNERD